MNTCMDCIYFHDCKRVDNAIAGFEASGKTKIDAIVLASDTEAPFCAMYTKDEGEVE